MSAKPPIRMPDVARDLEATLGADAVLWEPEDLLVYEYDGTIDRRRPDAIAFPRSAQDVVAILRVAREHALPVTPRGAGTGLSGGALAAKGGVIVAMNRMRRIIELDVEARTALVEPGVVNLDLGLEAGRHGLAYAPDPSSQRACTIGGNIAENAGGPHTLAAGHDDGPRPRGGVRRSAGRGALAGRPHPGHAGLRPGGLRRRQRGHAGDRDQGAGAAGAGAGGGEDLPWHLRLRPPGDERRQRHRQGGVSCRRRWR